MKFIYTILSISLVLMSITFLLPTNAASSEIAIKLVDTKPVRLSANSSVIYAKLNNPTAVFVSSNITLIGDVLESSASSGTISVFDKSNILISQFPTASAPSDLSYNDIGIFSLEGTKLVVYAANSTSDTDSVYTATKEFSNVTSYDIWDSNLYVASGNSLSIYELTADFTPIITVTFSQEITSISAGYFASGSSIYQITGESPALVATQIMTQNWTIDRLIIDKQTAYYTTVLGLSKFNMTDKTETDYSNKAYRFGDIAHFNNKIYFTNDFDNRISAIGTTNLSEISVVFASNHNIDGFFNTPTASVTRKDAIYTVDTGNNRIAINRNNNFTYITNPDFVSLQGVAVSTKNEIYVLDGSSVYIYSPSNVLLSKKTLTAKNINKIAITSSDEIYISSPTHIYRLSDMSVIKGSVSMPIVALGASYNDDKVLYAIGHDIFSTISETPVVTCDTTVLDFCVDNDGQIYVLDIVGNITKYSLTADTLASSTANTSKQYKPTIKLATPQSHFSQITLCRISNSLVGFGDIIVTSSANHSLYKFGSADFEVATFDESKFNHPIDVTESKSDIISPTSQVAQVTTEVQIFEFPIESRTLISLPTNTTLIVLQASVTGFENFSYVMYHDSVSKNAVYGYVYKQILVPTSYNTAPAVSCKIFNDKTKIYRFPSNYSPLIAENFNAAKNDVYEMLPFTDYVDSSENVWFRVKINGDFQGYVTKSNISIRDYEPNLVRPQSNAKIIAEQAALYSMTDGKFALIADEQPLIQGTEIEVVGMLDPSKEFTLIRYFDSKLGTLECYVLTTTIEYYNINSAQIIAVVLLSITLLFGLILVIRRVVSKRT